jgi:hypothetical protein
MLTCHTTAEETRGLALKLNIVSFFTAYTKLSWLTAGMFHSAIECLETSKHDLTNQMAPPFLDKESEEEIALLYPQFRPVLHHWRTRGLIEHLGSDNEWGETPSSTATSHTTLSMSS